MTSGRKTAGSWKSTWIGCSAASERQRAAVNSAPNVEDLQKILDRPGFPIWRPRFLLVYTWNAFKVDPDWISVKAVSEKNGALAKTKESTFMEPVAFSPMK